MATEGCIQDPENWLIHEGFEEGDIPMFIGEHIVDGFRMHANAVGYLQTCSGYKIENGKIECCCLKAADECCPTHDLLAILDRDHQEIDEMFASLMKWSSNSLVGQTKAFVSRA